MQLCLFANRMKHTNEIILSENEISKYFNIDFILFQKWYTDNGPYDTLITDVSAF